MKPSNNRHFHPASYWPSAALSTFALCCGVGAGAQQAPKPAASRASAQASAQIEAGEPRADTTPPRASAPAPAVEPSGSSAAPTSEPKAAHAAARAVSPASAAAAPGAKTAADRVDLGTATVTGDREQPKVMYIVPWKRSDIGDTSGKPLNSLLDEALTPVDRDEFKRQVAYYDALQSGASGGTAQGEK